MRRSLTRPRHDISTRDQGPVVCVYHIISCYEGLHFHVMHMIIIWYHIINHDIYTTTLLRLFNGFNLQASSFRGGRGLLTKHTVSMS